MQTTINLVECLCHCGMVYYVPEWVKYDCSCPRCSSDRLAQKETTISVMNRRLSALKGAITRMKRRAGKK